MMLVRPRIDIRIIPFSKGAHAGLAGSFELMRFEKIEPVVFMEAENSVLVVVKTASFTGSGHTA